MFDPTAFCVQLRPILDEDYVWTGELEVSILQDKYNPMDEESKRHMTHLAEIVACSVAFMEQNPDVIEKIEEFIDTPEYDETLSETQETTVESIEGNVIKLSFGSKTKGSA